MFLFSTYSDALIPLPTSDPEWPTSRPADDQFGAVPLVRAAALVEYPALVRELGADPLPLLASVGLTSDQLADPETLIPIVALGHLIQLGVDATGCESFGARLGQSHDLRTYLGTLGRVVWAAPDLHSAIARFINHIEAHAEGSRWTLDVDGELARLRNETTPSGLSLQGAGHNLVLVSRLMRAVTGQRLRFSLAYFAGGEPRDGHVYRALLGCPVLFDQEVDALVFHATDLNLAIPTADDQLSEILLRHGDLTPTITSSDLVSEVERLVEKNLLAGVASVDAVARFLPYSRSTLQQRLRELGTSHQLILDDVRDRWAKDRLVDSHVTVAELARTLGYGSADTFAVAFRRRNAMAPTKWRRRQLESQGSLDPSR